MKRFIGNRKRLILILLLLTGMPQIGIADVKVTLQWKSSNSLIEGYQVFCREEGQRYDYENFIWQGDNSFDRCTIDGLEEDKIYYFVVRSFTGDQMSRDSNEVRYPDDSNEDQSSLGCMIQSLFY